MKQKKINKPFNLTNKIDDSTRKILIKKEKRKRLQVYNTMDYFLNLTTFMDFYSKDLINILNNAQICSDLRKKTEKTDLYHLNKITEEDILYSFVLTEGNLKNTLDQYNLNLKNITAFTGYSFINNTKFPFSIFKFFLSKFIPKMKKFEPKGKPHFSTEVILLFENSVINAIERFKTPIITPEIFFLTLMESNNTKTSKLIKKIIPREKDWYMLRYELLKNLHFEELHIRKNVNKSQRHFGYILKSRLSQLEFSRLIDLDLLDLGVEYFRTKLFKKSLGFNILNAVKYDIVFSAKLHNRNYSQKPFKD